MSLSTVSTKQHYFTPVNKSTNRKKLSTVSATPTTNTGGFAGGAEYIGVSFLTGLASPFVNTAKFITSGFYDIPTNSDQVLAGALKVLMPNASGASPAVSSDEK